MDFKEDQLAIEAYVRMRSGWRDMDEISEEEYAEYAYEYILENPFAEEPVAFSNEALIYDRLLGEVALWRRVPRTHFYWEPGEFWVGMRMSLWCNYVQLDDRRAKLRSLAEYFGLIEVANED